LGGHGDADRKKTAGRLWGRLTKPPILVRKIAMSKNKRTMTDVLKAAIEESGVSRYRIAMDTGILQTSLSRFMAGETSLRLDKADVLAEYLGLELVRKRKAK
jgi:ribosome-binding protein aMBF1 (putative translation factor)